MELNQIDDDDFLDFDVPASVYENLTSGNSESSIKVRNSAFSAFIDFLYTEQLLKRRKNKKRPKTSDLSEDILCKLDILQQFAKYLVTTHRTADGKLLAPGAASTYLSGLKNFLVRLYPKNPLWKEADEFSKINDGIKRESVIRCIDLGVPIYKKSKAIGRHLLEKIVDKLLRTDSIESHEAILVLVLTFLAAGRGGEVAMSTFYGIDWDFETETMLSDWAESKTTQVHLMPFFADASSLQLCIYNCFAIFFYQRGRRGTK